MGARAGQRGCKEGGGKASPKGGWHPDPDYVGTVIRLPGGQCGIYTKVRKRYNKPTPVTILHHALKNESISGIDTPLIHLHCANQSDGAEEKHAEDYEGDVMGVWLSHEN